MLYCLLLVDGQGEAGTALLRIRTLRQSPGVDGLSVHFRPVRNDRLFESATFAGQLAYQILLGEGIVRAQLWVEYEVPDEYRNVAGRSSDLLFALALITAAWSTTSQRTTAIAATGVLDSTGGVHGVEHPAQKIAAAVRAVGMRTGAVIFYPAADAAAVEDWLAQNPPPAGVELRGVAHLDEALAYLGYDLDKVYLRNPFRGLEHFDYEHHAVFFGRDAEVRELVQQLLRREAARAPGVLVEGPSGSGKSSLLRAGLLPALVDPRHQPLNARELLGSRPVSPAVWRAVWRPGLMSAGADERAMARAVYECWAALAEFPAVWRGLQVESFAQLARLRRDHWPPLMRFVWLIDQFEEILSVAADSLVEALGLFLAALQADGVWTLMSVRANAMPAVKRHATLRRVFGANEGQYYLTPLSGLALGDVIARPARAAGLTFGIAPDGRRLDQLLLEEAIREPNSLPLLQFTLNELYLGRVGNELDIATYVRLGGLAGSVAATAKAVLNTEAARSRDALPRLFRNLVTVDDSGRAERRYAPMAEIAETPAQVQLVMRLVEARLCVTDQRDGQAVVAFAHDSLLRALPALTEWLRDETGLLQTRELAQREARMWQQHDRSDAWLAASDKLMAFRALGAARLVLPGQVRSFIQRSERLARRRTRIKRAAVCLMALLAVAASVAAWVASHRQREAEYQAMQTLQAQLRLLTQAAAERLKDGDIAYARSLILEVLRYESATSRADAAAVNVFQEIRATDPALAILSGHDGGVARSAYSPDGTRIVTASFDKTVRIWDARTGIELRVLSGHTRPVQSAAYSADGTRIVTAAADGTARVWDAMTGTQIRVLHDSEATREGIGPGNSGSGFSMAAFSPDNSRIVAAVRGGAWIWDARTGTRLAVLTGHSDLVNSASYSPDGSRIVTASDDRTARVWDAHTGAQLLVLSGHGDSVASAAFAPDGRHIVTASNDNTARTWDASTGRTLRILSGHVGFVWGAVYSPDGTTVATIGTDKTARLWDAGSGAQIRVLPGHVGILYSAAFSPDGSHLLTTSLDRTARIWELGSGQHATLLAGHGDRVNSVAYSPDGERLVTASEDKTARIWDARSGALLRVLSGHDAGVETAVYSRDGARIVTASEDRSARIWDAGTGRSMLSVTSSRGAHSAAFSPDGRRIVVGGEQSFGIWDASDGKPIAVRSGHADDVNSAVYSPDGLHILTASDDRTARIWDSRAYAQLTVLPHDEFVNYADYSPDGTRVVTVSDDRAARIWDARTGTQLQTLSGHHAYVHGAAFSPDGNRVITGSRDKTVRMWDTRTGTELAVFVGHTGNVRSVAYSPDGTHFASASVDRTVRIWETTDRADLAAQIIWAQAAEADPLSEVQRSQLGLSPVTALLTEATVRAGFRANSTRRFEQPATGSKDCAHAAGAYYDPDRRAPGMQIEAINIEIASTICARSAAAHGAAPQEIYQAGRALLAAADYRGARAHFESAASQGYRAARVDLALLLTTEPVNMLDPKRALSLLEQAYRQGVPFAAFKLGQLYERGIDTPSSNAGESLKSDPQKAWLWYQKAAAEQEPDALARFAQRDEANALRAASASSRDGLLLEAFGLYARAAEHAGAEEWPDDVWSRWRYRRASLARVLALEGRMQEVATAYEAVRAESAALYSP